MANSLPVTLTNSLDVNSTKLVVCSIVEQLFLQTPLTVTWPSKHNGLVDDLMDFSTDYRKKVEREGATPETALELYARNLLATEAVRLFNSYHEGNFYKTAMHLQACYQALILLNDAPAPRYVTLNTFIAALLGALPPLEHFAPVIVGTTFTQSAMLVMAYELQQENPEVFDTLVHEDYQRAFHLKAKQLMARFVESPDSAFVPGKYSDAIMVENVHAKSLHTGLRTWAVNASSVHSISVDYSNEDGYFGIHRENFYKCISLATVEKLIK